MSIDCLFPVVKKLPRHWKEVMFPLTVSKSFPESIRFSRCRSVLPVTGTKKKNTFFHDFTIQKKEVTVTCPVTGFSPMVNGFFSTSRSERLFFL